MTFDYIEQGQGPALLFLPGSYSSHAAWRGVQKALRGSYRLISTSLPGYGGTAEFRDPDTRDMSAMADFVARLVERAGEPVHLVGHSYGGLAVLASVLAEKVRPLSLVTFEANPIFSRRGNAGYPWEGAVDDMFGSFKAAVAADHPDAAAIIIDFWGRPGAFAAMPEGFQDLCRASARTNLIDWQSAIGFTPDVTDYSAITVPATIVRGEHANASIVDVSNEIVNAAERAALRVVPGSGHFLISTHPSECAAIIDAHMRACLHA